MQKNSLIGMGITINEKLTNSLLIPRFKVKADYPDSPFKVGEVLLIEDWMSEKDYYFKKGVKVCKLYYIENMSHLFREMEWWEERSISEMPKYLMAAQDINGDKCKGNVYEAVAGSYIEGRNGYTTSDDGFVSAFDGIIIRCFNPATLQDYKRQNSPRRIAMRWWNDLLSMRKTNLCDTNTDIVGHVRRWETLTGREVEMIYKKEQERSEKIDKIASWKKKR